MRPGKLVLFFSSLVLALPSLAASDTRSEPQTAPEPGQPTSTLQVYSRETLVDVIVTDSQGQAIRDLKRSDFVVFEDGKPQPIRSFTESGLQSARAGRALRTLPPGIHTNYQANPAAGPVNILLIDALHTGRPGIIRTLAATSQSIERMPAGTQMAIFWLSASGLHLLQGFTADTARLRQALDNPRTDIGSNLDRHTTDWYTVDALNQISEYVAGIKGRKNLLWFTPGMPVLLTRDGGYGWAGTEDMRLPSNNQGAADAATGANLVTVDPSFPSTLDLDRSAIDAVARLRAGDPIMDQWNLRSVFGDSDGPNMKQIHRLMDTYERFTVEQIAVSPINPNGIGYVGSGQLKAEEVAEQSGGRAVYNTNDLVTTLDTIIAGGSHYYTLSYIPPRRKPDGHYHTIQVKLAIPGAQLLYRKGYNAEDPKPIPYFTGPELIRASLQGKAPAAAELLFDARLAPAPSTSPAPPAHPSSAHTRKTPAQRTPYDLLVAVPQSQISFSDNSDGTHTASLRFAFEAYDINGKHLGGHSQDVKLALTPDRYTEFKKNPVCFHEPLNLFPGPLFLRIGVLDSTSNKVGTLEVPVTVAAPPR